MLQQSDKKACCNQDSNLGCHGTVQPLGSVPKEAFYFFGGSSNDNAYYGDYSEDKVLGEIGRLDAVTRTWSLAGSLKQVRSGHAVVFDGTQFLVLGGYGYQEEKFEIGHCVVNGTKITCSGQQRLRGFYSDYPELMLVDDNYGKDC